MGLVNSTLILGDGTRVNLPEDLLPVVGDSSDTARAARASEAYGHRAETWTYIGLAVLGASVATLIAVETGSVRPSVPDEYMFGGAALVTAIPFYVARHEGHEEMVLRMQAFSTYTRDLGIRLDVCAHGLEVVACETPISTPSPSQAPGAAP